MDRYNIHNSWILGWCIKMISKNRKIIIQKTDQQSRIPVFHIGNLSLGLIFWPGGGVEIRSIIYKKEMSLYNISGFKNVEDYQTIKEFIFEIYRKENSFNPSMFVVKNMTKRITECLSTTRIWIKKGGK